MIRACDLKQREVINVANAERLGYIYDVDVDFETGKINSIIIPNKSGMLGMFGKKERLCRPLGQDCGHRAGNRACAAGRTGYCAAILELQRWEIYVKIRMVSISVWKEHCK